MAHLVSASIDSIRRLLNDRTQDVWSDNDMIAYINEAILTIKNTVPIYFDELIEVVLPADTINIESVYKPLITLFAVSRCAEQDEQDFRAQKTMNEFEARREEMELKILNSDAYELKLQNALISGTAGYDHVVDVYYNPPIMTTPNAPILMLIAGTIVGTYKLTGVTTNMEYKINQGNRLRCTGTTVDNIVLNVLDIIYVRIREIENVSNASNEWSYTLVPILEDGTIVGTYKLTNVTVNMEYRINEGIRIACTGTEVDNIVAIVTDTIYVRTKKIENVSNASSEWSYVIV